MAGSTGKMTAEAIAARGPRMRLLDIRDGGRRVGFIVEREGYGALNHTMSRSVYVYAKSYTLGYLLKIGSATLKLYGR